MESTSKSNKYSKKVDIEEKEEKVKPEASKPKASKSESSEPELVTLELLVSLDKYVYKDELGNRLVWSGAGSTNSVSRKDADYLLSKMRVGSCCGGSPQRKPMFKEI